MARGKCKKRKASRRKAGRRGGLRGWLGRTVGSLALVGAAAAVFIGTFYVCWAFLYDLDQVAQMPERSVVFDRDGNFYARLQGENRINVPLEEVSPHFINALLAREDTRFYRHDGIDHIGIARATLSNLRSGRVREGASTITQQLARNSYPLGGQTLHRKILEALVALRMEQRYSKDEILEFYVNRIYFGAGAHGVESAAQLYLNKPSRDLTLGEAAMLVGIIRGPSLFSPFSNREGALRERDAVLRRMADIGMISEEAAERARQAPIQLASPYRLTAEHDYAMDAVRRQLDFVLDRNQLQEGGLRIHTTLDRRIQQSAQEAVSRRLDQVEAASGYRHPRKRDFSDAQRTAEEAPRYLQGAAMVADNRTGGILAVVGGRDYRESKYNRAISMRRQVGSTFKPFVYAAAYSRGLLPGALIADGQITAGEIAAAPVAWRPSNADGVYGGPAPAEEGLIRSRNTMSVRVGNRAGLAEVVELARQAGFDPDIPPYPATYLGAFESSLKQLVGAYMIFPNHGVRRQVHLIERIVDSYGRTLYVNPKAERRVMDPGTAWMVSEGLRAVIQRGTAARASALGLRRVAAGKTGTTNNFHDAWFVGYTESLTCAVWVGFDQPRSIQPGGYGSALALPIWVDVIEAADPAKYPASQFSGGPELRGVRVCSVTSRLATEGCRGANTAYDIQLPAGRIPTQPCSVHPGRVAQPGDDSLPERTARSIRRMFQR